LNGEDGRKTKWGREERMKRVIEMAKPILLGFIVL
jgi:hypothetical protein